MYSRKIIERVTDAFERKYGWRPQPHDVAEVEDFNDKVQSILVVDSNSVNKYYDFRDGLRITDHDRKYIRRWVENEQFMCFVDAEYFLTRYAWILGVGDEVIRYKPRIVQQIFLSVIAECDDLQVAIELFILKCRQLGVSTSTALYFLHRLLFRSNTKAVMASVKQQQSDLLQRMVDTCWQRLPFWLVPPKSKLKTSQPEWVNGGVLSMQSGSQNVGIAQGWTPNCIHISELGDYLTPKKTIEEGLFRAAHSHRSLFFVMEGTGNGDTGWQAEKWAYYKENWGKGGRFRPLFFPPAAAEDMYPLPDWVRKHPIPEGWAPSTVTLRMQHRAELYIRSTEYLSRFLGANWKMKREYMWFWETNYREAVSTHTEKVFLAQMACTDDEALQGKHDRAVDDDTIEVVSRKVERSYIPYAITGKSILIGSENHPYRPDPSTLDHDLPRIPLHHVAADGHEYYWELIPLKPFDESKDENFFDKLLVFKEPIKGANYSAGVDTADGLGHPNEDRASMNVLVNRTGKERDEQVAKFCSNRVNSPQMARIAAAIAVLYGEEAGHPMGVKFAIEQKRKPGDECQHQLKLMGFYYHHRMVRYDGKDMPDPSKATKEGWYTDAWSRSFLLDKFLDAVKSGWLKVNCPMAIRQIKALVRVETAGQSKINHPSGGHDDDVFSLAMAYITAHDMENNALRHEARYQAREERYQEVDYRYATRDIVLT